MFAVKCIHFRIDCEIILDAWVVDNSYAIQLFPSCLTVSQLVHFSATPLMADLLWLKIDIEVIESFKTSSCTLCVFYDCCSEAMWEGRKIGDCPLLSKSFPPCGGNGSKSYGGSIQSYSGL